ncbi:hypothetical protein [Paenibacillus terrigena]|uniref:hypothetical protein n=1 Tax=Paenibacillus terrigena TaxID=369333 RepID=UPI001B7FD922|nr:hypothetical protein [Paenibacillus terrigena]
MKAQASNDPILTTQLYFPNEPRNDEDFNDKLIMNVRVKPTARYGTGIEPRLFLLLKLTAQKQLICVKRLIKE